MRGILRVVILLRHSFLSPYLLSWILTNILSFSRNSGRVGENSQPVGAPLSMDIFSTLAVMCSTLVPHQCGVNPGFVCSHSWGFPRCEIISLKSTTQILGCTLHYHEFSFGFYKSVLQHKDSNGHVTACRQTII